MNVNLQTYVIEVIAQKSYNISIYHETLIEEHNDEYLGKNILKRFQYFILDRHCRMAGS